jgi:protoheme IX farnesyltransferase
MQMTKPAALPADWRDLYALTKPGVMRLVVFTALCGLLAAPVMPPFVIASPQSCASRSARARPGL